MTFADAGGNRFIITIPDPRDDLTQDEILSAMDTIIQKNIFQGRGGDLISKLDARIVETSSTDYYNP